MGDDGGSGGFAFESFLEGIFESCNRARIEKDVNAWFDLLVVATLNLSSEMDSFDLLKFKNVKKDLGIKINSLEINKDDLVFIPDDVESVLFDWEVDLRKIRRSAGLQHNVKNDNRRFT